MLLPLVARCLDTIDVCIWRLNTAFCIIFSLLMLDEDARGDHMEEAYSSTGLMTAWYVAMSVPFCFPHAGAVSAFIIWRDVCICVLRCCECVCCMYVLSLMWDPEPLGECHGYCNVYFELQITLISCRVWNEQSAWSPLVSSTNYKKHSTYMTKQNYYHFKNTSNDMHHKPNKNTTSITPTTQINNTQTHSRTQEAIFNNTRYTTNISTNQDTITEEDINTNHHYYKH